MKPLLGKYKVQKVAITAMPVVGDIPYEVASQLSAKLNDEI